MNLSDTNTSDYSTNDLLCFGFTSGRIFKRLNLNLNQNTKDTSNIFAKRIVKGKIDLYVWRHKKNNSKDFFVFNNESLRKSLLSKPKKSEIKSEGKTYNKSSNKYIKDLDYVKDNLTTESKKHTKLSFGEKSISKNVISFNNNFQEEYPVIIYSEPFKYNYTVLASIPFRLNSKELHFRVAVYRDKTFIDKTNTFSYLTGIIFQHWNDNDNNWINQYQNSE